MARIEPVDPATSSGRVRELFDEVEARFGAIPNMAKTMAVSPATLEGWLGLQGALARGRLGGTLGTQIALATAEANGCLYCLSIHGYVGKAVNNLSDEAILASRRGRSSDAKADAALRFARAVLETRGSVGDDEVRAVREAGFGDREISEIVAHVALNVLTNFFNKVAQVEVEFPAAQPLSAAA